MWPCNRLLKSRRAVASFFHTAQCLAIQLHHLKFENLICQCLQALGVSAQSDGLEPNRTESRPFGNFGGGLLLSWWNILISLYRWPLAAGTCSAHLAKANAAPASSGYGTHLPQSPLPPIQRCELLPTMSSACSMMSDMLACSLYCVVSQTHVIG